MKKKLDEKKTYTIQKRGINSPEKVEIYWFLFGTLVILGD